MLEDMFVRKDVTVGKPRTSGVQFLVRTQTLPITVGGNDYEVVTTTSALNGSWMQVRLASDALVDLPGSDTEMVITALLDLLNARRVEQD
jgi:hypothetical protein